MDNHLLTLVQSNATHQPDWLQKKRSLALMLQSRFSGAPEQQSWLKHWQSPQLMTDSEPSYQMHLGTDYVALPFQKAVLQYPELLQENLMEKAVRWQDNQLNAMHLALMDAGQFVYVTDQQQLAAPLHFNLTTNSQNPHNLIIVGAGANVTIEESDTCQNAGATYLATELLVGTGAHVRYCQRSQFAGHQVRHAIHVYQARQSNVELAVRIPSGDLVRSSLYSFLDGDQSQWQTKLLADAHQRENVGVQMQVDGYGEGTRASADAWGWQDAGSHLTISQLATRDDEPLAIQQSQTIASSDAVKINGQLTNQRYSDAEAFFAHHSINDDWLM